MESMKNLVERLKGVLEQLLKLTSDRTARYRLEAELEDLEDGHWDGARTDDPPESWFDSRDPDNARKIKEGAQRLLDEMNSVPTCEVCGLDVPGPHPTRWIRQEDTPHYIG